MQEEDRMTSVGSNFFVDVHLELTPIHVCLPEPDPLPLCVDVINERSLI